MRRSILAVRAARNRNALSWQFVKFYDWRSLSTGYTVNFQHFLVCEILALLLAGLLIHLV